MLLRPGLFSHSTASRPLIALWVACVCACSNDLSSSDKMETGGDRSVGAHETGGAGGPVETGGTKGTGGQTTHSGGSTTGGSATGVGGSTSLGGSRGTGGKGTGGKGTGGKGTGGKGTGSGGGESDGGTSAQGGSLAEGGSSGSGRAGGPVDGGTSSTGDGSGDAATAPGDDRSPGCGTAITRPNRKTQQTMVIGGTTRYYLLDVPSNADNQTPLMLVFALHGYDMNNVAVVDLFNFTTRSNGKAITVYPQGEGPAPGDTSHWGDQVLKSTWAGNNANYTYIQTLMTDLEKRFCIDKRRVFIAGFSMGGFFTNALACAHHDWFRAFAPVSGGVAGQSCADANVKPPIIIHHGTADTIVKPESGEATRDYWTRQNGCSQTSASSLSGCQSYNGCAQPVLYCVGNWDHTITNSAAGNIWSFFSSLE